MKEITQKDNFLLQIQLFFINRGWKDNDAFMFTLILSLFIFSLFITFVFGGGFYLIGLETAEQNIKVSFILNSLFFILSSGIYIIHKFEKKGKKNGN